jgi:hypothetical protein
VIRSLPDTISYYSNLAATSYLPDAVARYQTACDYALMLTPPDALDEVYAVLDGTDLIIVIRGSDEPGDWLFRNCMGVVPTWSTTLGAYVHGGFWSGCKSIIPLVYRAIRLLKHDRLIFVGHSKGGAMAHLLGLYFRDRHPLVYSYGSPRFAGKSVPFSTVNHYRVAHVYDPVCRVPPRQLGWEHHGRPLVYRLDGVLDSTVQSWDKAMKISGDIDTIKSLLTGRIKYHFDYGTRMKLLWVY